MYVDDFLIAADAKEMESLMNKIKQTWVCSEEEMVTKSSVTRFCGYEIQERNGGGFWLGQTGYLSDVLKRRQVEKGERYPCGKIEEGEDEELDPKAIKQAQMMVGEVLWLANRTRPDVAFTTGIMSRLLHRRPKYTCQLGQHLFRYLWSTQNHRLEVKPWKEEQKEVMDHLPHERGWETLEVYSDISYSPPHEQYRSIQGIVVGHAGFPISWESNHQGFVVQSTAESELIAYGEAYTAGESVASLLQVLEVPTKRKLLGDNKAALALCLNESGAWRTRHLRLRVAHLRSVLQRENPTWTAAHLKGTRLVADGFTKPLVGQAFAAFAHMVKVREDRDRSIVPISACKVGSVAKPCRNSRNVDQEIGALQSAGVAMIGSEAVALGSLVLMSAVALWKWWETRSSKANEQRPQKDLEKTRERGKHFQGSDEAAHPPQEGHQDMAVSNDSWSHGRNHEGGECPRVRAFRGPRQDDGQGQQGQGRPSARARGQAAMKEMDREGKALQLQVDVEGLTEKLDIHLKISDGGYQEAAGDQAAQGSGSMAAGSTADDWRQQSMRESGSKQSVQRNEEESSQTRRVQQKEGGVDEEPWLDPKFQRVERSSKDLWDLSTPGWAVRVHRHLRKRAYHPIHRSTPFNAAMLEDKRVTVCLVTTRVIVEDEWTDPKKAKSIEGIAADEEWRGYTFFRFKSTAHQKKSHEQIVSDGSEGYEFVDS